MLCETKKEKNTPKAFRSVNSVDCAIVCARALPLPSITPPKDSVFADCSDNRFLYILLPLNITMIITMTIIVVKIHVDTYPKTLVGSNSFGFFYFWPDPTG